MYMSKCVQKQATPQWDIENPKYKLHARRGTITIFFSKKLKNLTPFFRPPARNWKFQWNMQCHGMRYTNAHPHHQNTDAESCIVKRRRGETSSVELFDKKIKPNRSVRIRRKVVFRSYDTKGHAENPWNDIVNWRTNPRNSNQEFQHPAWTIINLRRTTSKLWANLPLFVLRLIKMLVLRTNRSTTHFRDSRRSWLEQSRSGNRACDKVLARLEKFSHIHFGSSTLLSCWKQS